MQRMTKQRQAVLDELTRVADFRSAQQIFEDLHSQGPVSYTHLTLPTN